MQLGRILEETIKMENPQRTTIVKHPPSIPAPVKPSFPVLVVVVVVVVVVETYVAKLRTTLVAKQENRSNY